MKLISLSGLLACMAWLICPPAHAASPDITDPKAARELFAGWNKPIPPFGILSNIWYVGAANVSSYLITSPQGHILVDTGFEDTVPQVLTNITTLGHDWHQIKFIVASHAHVDHVGGFAIMKELTHATICLSEADAALAARGGEKDFSPFPIELMRYKPVKADRIIKDGEAITLGNVTLTAHLTPGHTMGATTWTTTVRENDQSLEVLFFSSISIVEGTRLVGNSIYPNIVEDYRATFAKLRGLKCDVFLGPHGDAFNLFGKYGRLKDGEVPNPFIDREVLARIVHSTERTLEATLNAQSSARKP